MDNDIECYLYNGRYYCVYCLPYEAGMKDIKPIRKTTEVTEWPVCFVCHTVHKYMKLKEKR